jgi:hypothetical protein
MGMSFVEAFFMPSAETYPELDPRSRAAVPAEVRGRGTSLTNKLLVRRIQI